MTGPLPTSAKLFLEDPRVRAFDAEVVASRGGACALRELLAGEGRQAEVDPRSVRPELDTAGRGLKPACSTLEGLRRKVIMRGKLAAVLALTPALAVSGCTYLATASAQARLAHRQALDPRQRVYKHMIDHETFFVYGQLLHAPDRDRAPIAVVAVSNAFEAGEIVDVNHSARKNAHYGLHLPGGHYDLLVVRDANGDGFFDEREVIGGGAAKLDVQSAPERVLGEHDIDLRTPYRGEVPKLRIPVRPQPKLPESVFYPRGTIRSLDDDIFSREMATLGMYEPATFMERAPMLFYALEDDLGYKVPVVFVHGIDGSAREFSEIVAHLDRRRYKPWFFHYPSGSALSQLSEMFYRLFLSGKVIPLNETRIVIVAHSMGGLVVRDALNRLGEREGETPVARLVTIASPLGGHPGAAGADRGPLVLPSWRDLDPESAFIRDLHRKRLPAGLEYHLLYAYGNRSVVKLGANSDGVVPLSAQLPAVAQAEAKVQLGVDDTHTGVLRNPDAIRHVVGLIEQVPSPFPEAHLRAFDRGGYPVSLGPAYTPIEAYLIHNYGHWLDALASGEIEPAHPAHARFVEVVRGRASPGNPAEKAWVKFAKQYPDRRSLDRAPAKVGIPDPE
jgi:uncharacterized protein YifE (UPF0438 family)